MPEQEHGEHAQSGRPLQLRDGWPRTLVTVGGFSDRIRCEGVEEFCRATSFNERMVYPLSTDTLMTHGSFKKSVVEFKCRCRFAEPRANDTFPTSVVYPSVCGSLCLTASSEAERSLYRELLQAFGQCANRFGLGRGTSCADIILAVELFASEGGSPQAIQYYDLR